LTSGNITELPVSVSVPVDGAAGGVNEAEDEDWVPAAAAPAAGELELDELLHAAARKARGTIAAAVQARRVLVDNELLL
jgi:hypothetical protein